MAPAEDPRLGIARALAPVGLIPRGAFHPTEADGVPDSPGTLVLVGNAGPAMWRAFSATRRADQSLDEWTGAAIAAVASALGATALFPFGGPPFLPFQRWAQQAEPVYPSPIGILVHPDYGLWHAYRGAFAFTEQLPLESDGPPRPSPCDSCAKKPCLTSCPVDAMAPGRYDTAACTDHVRGQGGADCRDLGCRARRACPVGAAYAPAQAAFHMAAFLAAQP